MKDQHRNHGCDPQPQIEVPDLTEYTEPFGRMVSTFGEAIDTMVKAAYLRGLRDGLRQSRARPMNNTITVAMGGQIAGPAAGRDSVPMALRADCYMPNSATRLAQQRRPR